MVENEQLRNESTPKMVCGACEIDRAEMGILTKRNGNKNQKNKTKQKSLNYGKCIEQNESSNKNLAFMECLNDCCRSWCEFFPKMLTVDSLNLMFQIKSLETNK